MRKLLFKNRYLCNFHCNDGHPVRSKALLVAFLCCMASAAARGDFTFVAFGDTPYTEDEESRFIGMIAEINREKPAFVLHVGDFKNGWAPCTDALFVQRREWFDLFHPALIYTPGDNEWTDCWRPIGAARDPVERLQKLRSLFFADAYSLGQQKIPLTRQNRSYPEHARWTHDNVVFATLNVPGGGNNQRMPEEAKARGAALQHWLESTFETARVLRNPAVVLVMQANPFIRNAGEVNGYATLMKTIARESAGFMGQVLLIHGDTHQFRVDKPLMHPTSHRPLGNFTRIEVFGYPFMNWVRVRVAQNNGRISFTATPGS